MISATATGYSVTLSPRPLRIEKELKVIENFLEGKPVKPTKRHQRAIALLSLAIVLPPGNVYAAATDPAIPPEVDSILLKIQLICLGVCVSVAVIMAMIAGFFRMVGLREEARKRYMDACMGMVQVLSAPAVLGIISLVVRSVLKLFPGYVQ